MSKLFKLSSKAENPSKYYTMLPVLPTKKFRTEDYAPCPGNYLPDGNGDCIQVVD